MAIVIKTNDAYHLKIISKWGFYVMVSFWDSLIQAGIQTGTSSAVLGIAAYGCAKANGASIQNDIYSKVTPNYW